MRGRPAGLFDAHALIKERLGDGQSPYPINSARSRLRRTRRRGRIRARARVCRTDVEHHGHSRRADRVRGLHRVESFRAYPSLACAAPAIDRPASQPFFRRLLTRCISLVPSVIVAVAVGQSGINTLLVASQVVLSVVLPFVAFPLIYLTSRKVVMRVPRPRDALVETETETESKDDAAAPTDGVPEVGIAQAHVNLEMEFKETIIKTAMESAQVMPVEAEEFIDYSNTRWLTTISYVIWCVIVVANAYAIVMLFLRQGAV